MKNKLSKIFIALFLCIFIFGFVFVSNADNEVSEPISTSYDAEAISDGINELENDELLEDESEHEHEYLDENTISDNLYLFSDKDINIDYIVDGSVYICSAKSVNISSIINGNVFVLADTVNITSDAYIASDLFVVTNSLNISGDIFDVYGIGENITFNSDAYIERDIFVSGQNVNVYGSIIRNANIACEALTLEQNDSACYIGQNLNYSSSSEITVPEGSVLGEVFFHKEVSDDTSYQMSTKDILLSIIESIVFTLIIWLIVKFIAPKFYSNLSKNISEKPLKTFGIGFLALIVIPVVSVILFTCGVTVGFGFLLLALYIIALTLVSSIFIISFTQFMLKKYGQKINCNEILKEILGVILILIIVKLLKLIPIVGSLISFVIFIMGLGIIVSNLIPRKEEN